MYTFDVSPAGPWCVTRPDGDSFGFEDGTQAIAWLLADIRGEH